MQHKHVCIIKQYCAAGDSRAALAPVLAHKALAPGSFKWMLFGDDDTIFFVNSVLEFLQDFDPDLPYFISGGALVHMAACTIAQRGEAATYVALCTLLLPMKQCRLHTAEACQMPALRSAASCCLPTQAAGLCCCSSVRSCAMLLLPYTLTSHLHHTGLLCYDTCSLLLLMYLQTIAGGAMLGTRP